MILRVGLLMTSSPASGEGASTSATALIWGTGNELLWGTGTYMTWG